MKQAIAHLTPKAIAQAFEGTNFGRTDFDVILADTVLKRAAGYHSGGTATAIAIRLGLLSIKTERPTKAGHEWALEVFYSRRKSAPRHEELYPELEPNTEPCVICGVVSSHPEGWHYCHGQKGAGNG